MSLVISTGFQNASPALQPLPPSKVWRPISWLLKSLRMCGQNTTLVATAAKNFCDAVMHCVAPVETSSPALLPEHRRAADAELHDSSRGGSRAAASAAGGSSKRVGATRTAAAEDRRACVQAHAPWPSTAPSSRKSLTAAVPRRPPPCPRGR